MSNFLKIMMYFNYFSTVYKPTRIGIKAVTQICQDHVLGCPSTKFGTLILKIGISTGIWSSGKKVWKYNTGVNKYQIFLCMVDGHVKTDFLC